MLGAEFALYQSSREQPDADFSTLADFELRQIECWLRTLRWCDLNRPPDMREGLQ